MKTKSGGETIVHRKGVIGERGGGMKFNVSAGSKRSNPVPKKHYDRLSPTYKEHSRIGKKD